MVKKFADTIQLASPKKNTLNRNSSNQNNDQMNPQNPSQNQHLPSMNHQTNQLKKSANVAAQSGSGKTHDNPQVQQDRNQKEINGFEIPNPVEDDNQRKENVEESNDVKSTVSKKDTEYLKFYKFYYDKNKNEHPTWTPSQITTIISLLWKKKKVYDKKPSTQSCNTSRRSNKPLSAKDAFKVKNKQLSKPQLNQLWSKLPSQSKAYWKREGESYGNSAKLSEVSSVKNCKAPIPIHNTMRMLLNQV